MFPDERYRIKQTAERIVDFVCESGRQRADHRRSLPLGQLSTERLALVSSGDHFIEAAEQAPELRIRRRHVAVIDRLHRPIKNVIQVIRKDARWCQHPPHNEIARGHEQNRQWRIDRNKGDRVVYRCASRSEISISEMMLPTGVVPSLSAL
jgi:hypothetical protein